MIPHNKPSLDDLEIKAAARVITSGWVAQGEEVKIFEDEFCAYHGLPSGNAVAVSSGTAALFLALWVLNVRNELIDIPAYACTALQNAVYWSGGKPNYLDNAYDSPNVHPDFINNSDAKFAIVQHTYGIPIDVTQINRKIVIEDCCQALGAEIHGQKVGLFGEISTFSFYATKLITSGGQGGMVLSKEKSLIDKIKDFRNFDQKNDGKGRFNFQMTDLQAAIGRVQLTKLDMFLSKRSSVYNSYKNNGIYLLDSKDDKVKPVRYRAITYCNDVNQTIKNYKKNKISIINPFTSEEILGDVKNNPNAAEISLKTISLPIYPNLKKHEIAKIIKTYNALK